MRNHGKISNLHLTYRLIYIFLVWLTTSLFLNLYSAFLVTLVPRSNFYREFLICGGQIAFQSVTILIIGKEKLSSYLINMMSVSLIGTILLVPALIAGTLGLITAPYFFLGYFLIIVGIMLLIHWRRVT